MTTFTRTDGLLYVSETLGNFEPMFDVEAIVDDLYGRIGHWNFRLLDSEDCDTVGVNYWRVVADHERRRPGLAEWLDTLGYPADTPRDRGE